MLKITMENQAILKRIQEKQPTYDVIKWEEDRFEKEQLIKNIAEYHKTHFGSGQGFDSFRRVTSHSPNRAHPDQNLPNINPMG